MIIGVRYRRDYDENNKLALRAEVSKINEETIVGIYQYAYSDTIEAELQKIRVFEVTGKGYFEVDNKQNTALLETKVVDLYTGDYELYEVKLQDLPPEIIDKYYKVINY